MIKKRKITLILLVPTIAILLPILFGNRTSSTQDRKNGKETLSATRMTDFLNDRKYPQDFWQTAAPGSQGMDAQKLQDLVNYIDQQRLEIHGLLIVKNGYLVLERYGRSVSNNHLYTPYDTHVLYSTTKSVVSALIGIAISEKLIHSVNDNVISLFPYSVISNMSSQKSNITLEHLLTMTSGMSIDDDQALPRLINIKGVTNPDYPVTALLYRRMEHEPGTFWNYDSGSSHLLSIILSRKTGRSALDYGREKIFKPLGIQRYKWDSDSGGNNFGGTGLELTPRDMLKFGFLYLNKGMWKGKRILGEDWVSNSTTAHSATTWVGKYGLLWWVPDGSSYYSQGANGQNIFVFPSRHMVVVYTANLPMDNADQTLAFLNSNFIIPSAGMPDRSDEHGNTAAAGTNGTGVFAKIKPFP